MNNQVQQVQVRAVLPLEGSFALFLGNAEKTFVIYIDEQVGGAIAMFMRNTPKERPLTHDLLANVLVAFGARVDRVVINDMNGSVFYARLILSAENQLQSSRKVVELDARPSDSIAMAIQQNAPIYVADAVWNAVDDVSDALKQIESKHRADGDASEDDEEDEEMEEFFDEDEDEEDDDFDDDDDEDEEFDEDDDDLEYDDEDEDEEYDEDEDDDSDDEDDEDDDEDPPSREKRR